MIFNNLSEKEMKRRNLIKGDKAPCFTCGRETDYIEFCSEAHFCSDKCIYKFYEELEKEKKECMNENLK